MLNEISEIITLHIHYTDFHLGQQAAGVWVSVLLTDQLVWHWKHLFQSSYPCISLTSPWGVIHISSHGSKGLILINLYRIWENYNSVTAYISKCLTFPGCFISKCPSTISNILLLSGKNYSFIHYTHISVGKVLLKNVLIVWWMENWLLNCI